MKTIESVKEKFIEGMKDSWGTGFNYKEDYAWLWPFIEQSIKESLEATKLKREEYEDNNCEDAEENSDPCELCYGTYYHNWAVKEQQELIDKYLNKK